MNAIASTIKASQDSAAAAEASKRAKTEMQAAIFAEARARVAGLIREFNETPMELQPCSDGTPTGKKLPLYSSYGVGKEYALMGKGLRFFLCWAADGRTLCLLLNAVCRHAHNVDKLRQKDGLASAASVRALEASTDLLTAAQAQDVVRISGFVNADNKNLRIVGHITLDGHFGVGGVPYDEKERPEFLAESPASWLTNIIGGYEIAPYVVLKPAARLKKRGAT